MSDYNSMLTRLKKLKNECNKIMTEGVNETLKSSREMHFLMRLSAELGAAIETTVKLVNKEGK